MSALARAGYPRLFHGNSRVRNVSSMTTYGVASVFCMELSPDGRFLATGDEDGTLEIRNLRCGVWQRVCLYSTGAAVRTLVWHPSESGTIFSGSANGAIHKITVVSGGNNLYWDGLVPSYVHLLQLSPDGQRLVIAHGHTVSIVENPFPQRHDLGTLINLEIALVDNVQTLGDCYIPRGIFFVPNDDSVILIAFLGRRGLRAYSLVDKCFAWSIPLRGEAVIGSAAISPSGERIAIMNLQDGIDFYSTSRRQYLSTTRYELSTQVPPQNFIVDILFVDDETVAFGHSDGKIGFATFGVDSVDTAFEMGSSQERAPVQVITFGLVNASPLIFGLASTREPRQSSIRYPSDIHIGKIETPGVSQDLGGVTRPQSRRLLVPKISISLAAVLCTLGVTVVPLLFARLYSGIFPPEASSATSFPSRIATIDPPQYLSTATSTSDPLSTCICTVTGVIDAAKESGIDD